MKKIKISVIGLSGESIFLNVDKFHKDGETKHAKKMFIEPGGKGYNQAVACKKLGCDVSYLSSVGNDSYGKTCESYMKEMGINTFFQYKDDKTCVATILTNDLGDNRVTVYSGASKLLNLSDLDKFKDEIKSSDILLINNEIPYEVLKEAIRYAKLNNIYIILNPAPAIYDLSEVIKDIDLLIPNEEEALSIYNKKYDEISDILAKELIITLGKNGCCYLDNKKINKYEARKVNVVDTTGAGDVFCASIASRIKIDGIDKAIKFASVASSIHITKPYVLDAIPTLDEVLKEI